MADVRSRKEGPVGAAQDQRQDPVDQVQGLGDIRSGCPINLSLEVFGDRWSLVIIRDLMFGDRRHFNELLAGSEEGIASNILSDRLKRLVRLGMVTKRQDPTHKQKSIYSLTEISIELVPVLALLGAWGRRHLPVTEELGIRAQVLEEGGSELWERFMNELRVRHLGAPESTLHGPSATDQMRTAYEEVVARNAPPLVG
ncbi:MAG TPA: helix-turn-helix domain-containing protein [Humibacter sp.]|nr:helix-turn-helix domain-containing protein [Humibacter sp.]